MSNQQPVVLVIMQALAVWCIERASKGDVDTDTLVDNIAKTVKEKIIPAIRHNRSIKGAVDAEAE